MRSPEEITADELSKFEAEKGELDPASKMLFRIAFGLGVKRGIDEAQLIIADIRKSVGRD